MKTPLKELVKNKTVSVELRRVLEKDLLLSFTVGEYLIAGEKAYNGKEIYNFAAKELKEIVNSFCTEHNALFDTNNEDSAECCTHYVDISLLELISNTYVSARLENALVGPLSKGIFSFSQISEYVSKIESSHSELLVLKNFGRKSLRELDALVSEYCNPSVAKDSFVAICTVEEILDKISGALTEREFEILLRRNGLFGLEKETLEQVGEHFEVTRERVRQIEKKLYPKLKSRECLRYINSFLDSNRITIEKNIFHSCGVVDEAYALVKFTQIERIYSILLEVVFDDVIGWLECNYTKRDKYWVLPSAECDELPEYELEILTSDWKRAVKAEAESMHWPVDISVLAVKFPQFYECELEDFFVNDLGAIIENNLVIRQDRLSTKARMGYVLRSAGHELHTSDVRAKHMDMFGFDISEHFVNACLCSMENALIVSRGVYNIYENLTLTAWDIKEIRDKVFCFLELKNEYVSAKVIYRELFLSKGHQYGVDFNDYMLLGLLQDDERFSVRRGLMVAILDSDVESQFISLTEELVNIVKKYGPISIPEIKKYIKDTRSILDVTIGLILKSSPEIIKSPQKSKYDDVENVIGGKDCIDQLNCSIDLCLIDSGKSIHYIQDSLRSLGGSLPGGTIKSWILKSDRYTRQGKIYYLDNPSEEIIKYNEFYNDLASSGLSGSKLKNTLMEKYKGLPEVNFINLDCRLLERSGDDLASPDLLDSLLEEMKFL
jgi:RNA polymerase primary sigma factor